MRTGGRLTGLWWWIDRWRKSRAYMDLNLEEQGAYRNLLDEARLRAADGTGIPDDDRILAKACGDATRWKKLRKHVLAHFTLEADGWHNATLEEIVGESDRRSRKQRAYRERHGGGNEAGNAAATN
jgi:uncharacterized protein YdaU (DUF1376 family)